MDMLRVELGLKGTFEKAGLLTLTLAVGNLLKTYQMVHSGKSQYVRSNFFEMIIYDVTRS